MDLRLRNLPRLRLLALVVTLSAALAAGGAGAAGPVAAKGGAPAKTQSFNDLSDAATPIRFTSNEGRFSVVFPSGCAKVRSRLRVGGGSKSLQDANLVFTNCDRAGRQNEGCSVTARPGEARGLDPAAATAKVLDYMRQVLGGYDVKPVVQTPLRRDFGEHGVVEGLEIVARAEGTAGDVCVRGLLHDEDIYVLTAWKATGGMAEDPEYSQFFQSFLPWADADFMRGE
jgi:hypothetical protein